MTERNRLIAENIRSLLRQNNIQQKELANKVGISASTLSDYLNLRSSPSHGVIQKIADYFNVGKSDIDSTYKDESEIQSVYDKLNNERKDNVLDFAKFQLAEQNSIVRITKSNDQTPEVLIAAHITDGVTEEGMEEILNFIEKVKKEQKDK